ncbi:MAG: four helix bundle protein, partial [Saprospiraceae bacterium]
MKNGQINSLYLVKKKKKEKKNPIVDKSYSFALKIIQVYQNISSNKKEFVLSKQLLRSGTSIG